MSTYLATDSLDALDATTPAGSEDPGLIDDAIREAKLVFKTVARNHLTTHGALRRAAIQYGGTAPLTGFTANTWTRLGLVTTIDPTNLFLTGAFAGSVKPIAGNYIVRGWCSFFQSGAAAQNRASVPTSNTASTAISGLCAGAVESSSAATASAVANFMGLWTTDGTVSMSHDVIMVNSAGQVGNAIGTNGLTGPFACIDFEFLGTVL